ncbi:16S rRNA (guanine(966)-N(2))-methyltransferase RsmD [Clostridium sp. JN-1]|jgi:16S rRNA (guanine(966)-N(2))-methyltransferase RsmD|uniref:16S rRNA (guanine(966)-N(2))-methyltransferase RsmD n=1 Tax=Clostridium sp. JN-1 TaxID=2483110 RepID=UPI000F0BA9ED|nr:16S rRNA (guanine(966)-N(2))-methyltransferase RsmD [Clostridium sp. JN-1]
MRIIAGLAKGRKIMSPIGANVTRPTLDRIKEAIFNIIQMKVYGSTVLDMFSGTGSLGLEAASRGCKSCYLVDQNPQTYSFLVQNVKNLKFEDRCKCINMNSYRALEEFKSKKITFDLIFIDPPYMKDMIPPAIESIDEKKLLSKTGIIVTKIDTAEKLYGGNSNIVLSDHRKYGNTTVCFYNYKEDN